jgi:hypothetical protein
MAGRPQRRARMIAAQAANIEYAPLSPLPEPDIVPTSLDYNDPNISSKNFLFAVMWDQTVDLELRIRAAEMLLPFTVPMPATVRVPMPVSTTPSVLIKIEAPLGMIVTATVEAEQDKDTIQ